jgi:pSer/pThr/pTyr-binding forkhead associated (FHA) protein
MGALQRLEQRLSGMVEGLFARAFKSEVQPVEVAAALQRELDGQAAVVARDRILVPNHFVVDLGDHDHERLSPYEKPLTKELAAMVREHAEDQHYTFVGTVTVELRHQPSLDTGVFRIKSDVVAGAEVGPLNVRPAHEPPRPQHPPDGVRPDDEPRRAPDIGAFTDAPAESAASLTTQEHQSTYGRVMVREGRNASYEIDLRRPVTVIGRGSDADLRLADQAVSRRHAEIRVSDGEAVLNDLQSTNGTTVNGARVTTTSLADGDEVRPGETLLIFRTASRG